MTTTTYYNLNIVEGTDIVNPLIVDNPNYEKIDETMHNNAVSGVTLATEIANATVHAITRENSECAVIRFIATSAWKAGDTATVDGVPVTALLPSGETLPDGAYVINANVLCILTGTNLTIYAERKKAENANEIAFNNTTVAAELVRLDEEIDNVIKPPTTSALISSAWNISQEYTADEDCWLVATATPTDAEYARLQIYDSTLPLYMDKEMSYGKARGMYVKLYVKKGASVTIDTEGNFGNISLYKLK